MSKNKEVNKDTLVKREITRLTNLYKDIEKNRRLSAKGLIEEAAFMRATLTELKKSIDENGPIDEMPQGEYSILREHPALKSYNTMVQRYSSIIKQLTDLLPKEVKVVEDDDGFQEFINNRAD
ncbi:hypothetical protein [Tissierella praeacuta]|uniref:hypothetical protein n=1 Tax=Tissierella praeacuta TaxID=43131 RepID=UPI0028AAD39E|nr:hypothetical protein [Tissierella praeacuta]